MLIMTNNRQPNSGKVTKTSCRTLWYHPYCVPNPNLLFQNTCIPKRQRWFWGCHKIAGCDNYRKNEKSKEDKGRLLLSLICSERKLTDLISHKQVIIHWWPKMLTQENVRQYILPETTAVSDLRAGNKREGKVTLLKKRIQRKSFLSLLCRLLCILLTATKYI